MIDTSKPTVHLLHTVPTLPSVFDDLLAEQPVTPVHVVDTDLLTAAIEHGGPQPGTVAEVAAHVARAEAAGSAAVLVTCSSIGEAAEAARPDVGIPVLRVDEPMAAAAVDAGEVIGVVATLRSTVEPTVRLIERIAADRGAVRQVRTTVCDGAFEALRAGRVDEHDALVVAAARAVAAEVDVLVLAQASAARAVAGIEFAVPVLRSPESGAAALVAVASEGRPA